MMPTTDSAYETVQRTDAELEAILARFQTAGDDYEHLADELGCERAWEAPTGGWCIGLGVISTTGRYTPVVCLDDASGQWTLGRPELAPHDPIWASL